MRTTRTRLTVVALLLALAASLVAWRATA
jgi:hypothetical protein